MGHSSSVTHLHRYIPSGVNSETALPAGLSSHMYNYVKVRSYLQLTECHHPESCVSMQLDGAFVLGWCEEEGAAAKGSTRSSRLYLV